MRKIRNIILVLLLFVIAISCNKKSDNTEVSEKSKVEKDINLSLFTSKSVEKVVEEFEKKAKENNVDSKKFEKIIFEGKSFYQSKINDGENSIYTINYTGIDVNGLFAKVKVSDNSSVSTTAKLKNAEKIVLTLIEISDSSLTKDVSREIYFNLLSNLEENALSNTINYKNGITYGFKISEENQEIIFFSR